MAAAIIPPDLKEPDQRHRLSRAEYDNLLGSGIFGEQRLELLAGELINKMGQKPAHSYVIQLLQILLTRIFGARRVMVQRPVEVSDEYSLPEPDLAVIPEFTAEYAIRFPHARELSLLIEVADTSLRQDTTIKRDLYARAGVSTYWVIDIPRRRVILYQAPESGAFQVAVVLEETERLEVEGTVIPVSDILPPRDDG